jgi:glycosyltransferase involved in cell wall biosynthesis
MPKSISVVIACYNSEKVIATTLKHLQNQKDWKQINWEILLVNNNSTDLTVDIALETWNQNPIVPLKIILEEKVGEANARKAGIKAAQYEIISVVDDDNWVSENWISTISTYFDNPEIGLVGCAGDGEFESTPPLWFEENKTAFAIGKLYDGDFVNITKDALVPGAGLSMRKCVYDLLFELDFQPLLQGRVGTKQSAGADSEMCYITRLLGYKIYYSNQLKFKHFTATHRISWERLKLMTQGFGESDVFTLPYQIIYKESVDGKKLITSLRKKWWFNYFGKKIALFIKDPFQFIPAKPESQQELLRIRNKAFCDTILNEKAKFEESFLYLEKIISEKNKTISKYVP